MTVTGSGASFNAVNKPARPAPMMTTSPGRDFASADLKPVSALRGCFLVLSVAMAVLPLSHGGGEFSSSD